MAKQNQLVRLPGIESRIYLLRGQKVMFDYDLAQLYGVTTSNLNKAVRRNLDRFPEDFMFQLTKAEVDGLIFQFGISKGRGGRRFFPYAFTQEGIAMLSGVLRSERAVAVNIEIMRAFVRLRNFLASQGELARKLAKLQHKVGSHDQEIQAIFQVLKRLMTEPRKRRREIGFHGKD